MNARSDARGPFVRLAARPVVCLSDTDITSDITPGARSGIGSAGGAARGAGAVPVEVPGPRRLDVRPAPYRSRRPPV
ncbi:hypothetical protein GCM10023075_44950 [Streptosporangium album]